MLITHGAGLLAGVFAWWKVSLALMPFVLGMANETKQVFFTLGTAISHAATLANGANTYDGLSGCTTNEIDNSVLKYPYLKLSLHIPDTFAAAPTAGATIDVFYVDTSVDGAGTSETPVPAATDILYNGTYLCSFVVDNQDVATIKSKTVPIDGLEKFKLYIANNTGQTLSYSSNPILLKYRLMSYGPS